MRSGERRDGWRRFVARWNESAISTVTSHWTAELEGCIDRQPLMLSPDTLVRDAIAQLSQCDKPCAVIVSQGKLCGLFTEFDAVRSLARTQMQEEAQVVRVMTANPCTVSTACDIDFLAILGSMRQRCLQHLPVLDGENELVGTLSLQGLQEFVQSSDLLRSHSVQDLMRADGWMGVRTADSLAVATWAIASGSTGCVAVCQPRHAENGRASFLGELEVGLTVSNAWSPVGIITESDVVRLQQAGWDFNTTLAGNIMSAPLVPVRAEATAWRAHQLMREQHVRRLLVVDRAGCWKGLLTLSDLMYAIDPVALQASVSSLQERLAERTLQLHYANQQLQQRVDERAETATTLSTLNSNLERRVSKQTTELRETVELLRKEVAERQQAQTQLHRFFRLSQDLICTIGFDEYFKQVNPACEAILGYTKAELLALNFSEIVCADDRALVARYLEMAVVDNETISFDHRYCDRDGQEGWLSWRISPGFPEGMLYGVARECTDAKRVELALRQSTERIHLITDAIPAYIAYVDTQQRYRFTNRQHETWLSIPVSELAGRKMPEVLGERNYAPMESYTHQALAGDEVTYEAEFIDRYQHAHVLRYVHIPHVGDSGEVEGFFLLAQDITAEKRAEEKLRASERKFRVTFDRAFQAIGLLSPDGIILDANQTALDFAGVTLDAVVSRSFAEMVWLQDAERERVRTAIARAVAGDIVRYEMTVVSAAGKTAIVDFSLKPIANDEGTVMSLIAEGRDITASKQAEIDRRNAREKEILLKEIHHRVKNNLQIVSGLLYLQSRHPEGRDIEQILQDSRARLHSMALIHEKLYLSETFDAIDFGNYAHSIVQSLVSSCAMNAEVIDVDIDTHSIRLELDVAIPCGLIVNELVTNALKHAFAPGMSGSIAIGLARISADVMELRVSNSGDAAGLPSFADPPLEDAGDRNSLPLGMKLVRALAIKQLEGNLSVENTDRVTFVIRFPMPESPSLFTSDPSSNEP